MLEQGVRTVNDSAIETQLKSIHWKLKERGSLLHSGKQT